MASIAAVLGGMSLLLIVSAMLLVCRVTGLGFDEPLMTALADTQTLLTDSAIRPLIVGMIGLAGLVALWLEGRLARARQGLWRVLLALMLLALLLDFFLVHGSPLIHIPFAGPYYLLSLIGLLFLLPFYAAVVVPLRIAGLGFLVEGIKELFEAAAGLPLFTAFAIDGVSPAGMAVVVGGFAATTMILARAMGDTLVLVAGLLTSRLFRMAVWATIRIRPSRIRHMRWWPGAGGTARILRPPIRGFIAGTALFAGILVSFSAFFVIYPMTVEASVRQAVVGAIGTMASSLGAGNQPGLSVMLLVGLPHFILFVVLAAWRMARGRSAALFWEGAAATALAIILVASLGEAEPSGIVGFVVGLPLFLGALAVRSQVWQGVLEAGAELAAARQRDAEEAFRGTTVRPILFLRAFVDDAMATTGRFRAFDVLMGVYRRRLRFEELIASRAECWRPIVALGNPHLPFQLSGALKQNVGDGDWQEAVARWHGRCAYTVMIANTTRNIGWEVELVRSTGRLDQAIFVVTDPERATRFFRTYPILEGAADVPAAALVVYHDHREGWMAITAAIRTHAAYSLALDVALARVEEGLRRGG